MKQKELNKIEAAIAEGKVMTVVRLPWVDADNPEAGDCADRPGEYFIDPTDLIVYTVGNHTKGRREILAFGGPLPGELPLTRSQLYERAKELELFVMTISSGEGVPVKFPRNRIYQSDTTHGWLIHAEHVSTPPVEIKETYMDLTADYYGHTDFQVDTVTSAPGPDLTHRPVSSQLH